MSLTQEKAAAQFAYESSSVGWISCPSFALYYAYRFKDHFDPSNKRLIPWWVFASPVPIFLLFLFNNQLMAYDFTLGPFGWIEIMDPYAPMNYVFLVFALVSLIVLTYTGLSLKRKVPSHRMRLHATMFSLPVIFISFLVFLYHMVFPIFKLSELPPFAQVFMGIWFAAFSLMLNRYPILSISPVIAADQIVNSMSDICLIIDKVGIIRAANLALETLLGYNRNVFLNRTASNLLPAETLPLLYITIQKNISPSTIEVDMPLSGGGTIPCQLIIAPIHDSMKDTVGAVLIGKELRELKRLSHLTLTDDLTGAYNRRMMNEALAKALAELRRKGTGFTLVCFDIDYFKAVNDQFGHATGDRVLSELSKVVRTTLRNSDTFIRWGGEEFMIICYETEIEEALALVERIRLKIREHDFGLGRAITSSFGVTKAERNDSVEAIAERADTALYQAKAKGRDRCERA